MLSKLSMNHEELYPENNIKTAAVSSSPLENLKTEEATKVPPPPLAPARVLLSNKIWSENKQRYFYKPKDPDYAKNHYWKTKCDMQCEVCGVTVSTAMHRHLKSLRCKLVKERVQNALDKVQIEGVKTLHQEELNVQHLKE